MPDAPNEVKCAPPGAHPTALAPAAPRLAHALLVLLICLLSVAAAVGAMVASGHRREWAERAAVAAAQREAERAAYAVEAQLDGLYFALLQISLDPDVQSLRRTAQDRIQAFYAQWSARYSTSEVYVIQRDFDGTERPWMTFEAPSERAEDLEFEHSLEYERDEYRTQVEQMSRFAAQPETQALLSPPVALCLRSTDGTQAQGVVYSVPIRRGGRLVGMVSAMVPEGYLAPASDPGEISILVNSRGDIHGGSELSDETRRLLRKRFADARAEAFRPRSPGPFQVGQWMTVWAPTHVVSETRWWAVHQYRVDKRAGSRWSGLLVAAGALLLGLTVALCVHLGFRHSEAKVEVLNERLQAETAAAHSGQIWRETFDAMADGVVLVDATGTIQRANAASQRMLGFSEDELVGRAYGDAMGTQSSADGDSLLPEAQRTRRPLAREVWVRGRWYHVGATPTADGPGQADGAILTLVDMTERKAAEDALRQSEDRFRTLFETAPVGVAISRPDGTVVTTNPALSVLLGWSRDEFRALSTAVTYADPPDRQRLLDELDARGEAHGFETRLLAKDGTPVDISLEVRRATVDGQTAQVSFLTDIRERRRAEKLAAEAARLDTAATLAGGIAHEINNRMVAVLGYAEFLGDHVRSDAEALEMLRVVADSARGASDLAQKMLAFARGGKYQTQTVQLNTIVRETTARHPVSADPAIAIELRLAPDLPQVHADPTQLAEVVRALLDNAREAIEGGGRVCVCTESVEVSRELAARHTALPPGPHVKLSVSDTGVGMDEATRARIFEPFFTTKFLGRGLGLAAVYGIAANHGGHVTVASGPGLGATLEVFLPIPPGQDAS
jgi:PAS domain S-box-containing protein